MHAPLYNPLAATSGPAASPIQPAASGPSGQIEYPYALEFEDLVAFHDFYLRHGALPRRQLFKAMLILIVSTIVLVALFHESLPELAVLLPLFLWAVFLLRRLPSPRRRTIRAGLRALLADKSEAAFLLGPRRLVVGDSGVVETRSTGASMFQWAVFRRIVSEGEHLFLQISDRIGLIVPLRFLPPHERAGFVAQVAHYHQQALAEAAAKASGANYQAGWRA